MLGVLVAYGIGWLLHLEAIARLPLYLAQVGVGASLVVTALLAAFVMGEPLRREHWIAVCTMVGGLGVLAIAAGSIGTSSSNRSCVRTKPPGCCERCRGVPISWRARSRARRSRRSDELRFSSSTCLS